MRLKNLQDNFIETIFSDNEGRVSGELNTEFISPKGLMDIYRNNTFGNTTNAMKLTYPVVEKLVGDKFFRFACYEFIKQNAPVSGNLDDYGSTFGGFLDQFVPAKTVPYLPDTARLEWLIHQSSVANKSSILDQRRISQVAQEEYLGLKFSFHSSARLFFSKYPIYKIWQANQDNAGEIKIDINDWNASYILVIRSRRKAYPLEVTKAEHSFLKKLHDGSDLYNAFEAATEVDEEFDLAFYLQKHILSGTFSDFLL